MKLWMAVMRDLESVMNDCRRIFDAWAEGGVDGVVVGPLVFNAGMLLPGALPRDTRMPATPAFEPDSRVYGRFGVEPPAVVEHASAEQRRQLEETLQEAKKRGFAIYIMYPESGAGPGGDGHYLHDERSINARIARMVDTVEHFPMVDGAVLDGPEWGYEIAPGHMNYRSYIFNDLPLETAPLCEELNFDYNALLAAKDRLFALLHNLDPMRIRLHADGGLLGGFQLLGGDPDLMSWMKFRVDSLTAFFRRIRDGFKSELGRSVRLGTGPRTAVFAPLCGYDFGRLAEFMDFLSPKHYFWHRGFDGLVGTIHRYVETLMEWNPGLAANDAIFVVQTLFGIALPGVREMRDFDKALCPEFFEQIVAQETRRALAAVDDPDRIIPWVDAGRFPHDGDPMSADDLRQILEAAQDAGLRRFLYHHQGNLTAGEWVVISEMCGKRWDSRTSSYKPPDMMVL